MYKLLTFALIAAATLSGCNKSSTPAPAAATQPATSGAKSGDAVDQKLQSLAGNGATACGRVAQNGDVQSASDCALKANEAKHPFFVAYDLPGMSVGVASAADGKLYSVTFSADAYKPAETTKGQLSEDNHLLTVDCPAALRVAQSGRLTCFPAASAPGASPHGGGMMAPGVELSLSWLPPVMKTPVAFSRMPTRSGSWDCSRLSGRTIVTSAAPSARNSASYTSTISSPRLDAVGSTAIRASGPPLAATNSFRMRLLRSLSSAPPMIMRGPRGMGATLGPRRDETCQTLGVKTLVVIRHSKSEQSGPSDFERQLTDRGMVDATEAGQWLANRGIEPDQALVSAAVRTQQTWEAVNEAGGWDLEGTPEDSLYEAGTESALDLIRETEDVIRTLVVVGPQPDDGVPGSAARRRQRRRGGRQRDGPRLSGQCAGGVLVRRRLERPRRGLGERGGLPRGPWLTGRALRRQVFTGYPGRSLGPSATP